MTKANLLSICLLATLLAPLAGCQLLPQQKEAQASNSEAQALAQAQARAHEARMARERETKQAREREAELAREREAQQDQERAEQLAAREREAQQARDARAAARHGEVDVAIGADDIALIQDYYRQGHPLGNTLGRITKLRRGEAYPFGYTWRPLPGELEARLAPLPKGYARVLVGTAIGIMDLRNRVVVDTLNDLHGKAKASEARPSEAKAPVPPRKKTVSKVFSSDDIAAIRDYYKQGNSLGMTLGRVAKLRRGEPYPFGCTWRPLPGELDAQLSPLPKGYGRVLVGTEVGILDMRTRVVVDLVDDLAA